MQKNDVAKSNRIVQHITNFSVLSGCKFSVKICLICLKETSHTCIIVKSSRQSVMFYDKPKLIKHIHLINLTTDVMKFVLV